MRYQSSWYLQFGTSASTLSQSKSPSPYRYFPWSLNMDTTFPIFSVFASLGFLFALVPLYWQFEAWSVGIVSYIAWTALSCLVQYFNSVVWDGNTANSAPVWCEISIRLTMAATVGLPAASLCINRRLYLIAQKPATVDKVEKRRAIIIDSFLCVLFPVLHTGLQIIVQRHRFDILEDVGCVPDFYNSLSTYVITFMWPVVLGVGSLVYCGLSGHAFASSRANLDELLSSHRNLSPERYLRVTGLASATVFLVVPLGLLTIATSATASFLATAIPADLASFEFGLIAQIPRALWAADANNRATVELGRWIYPACALLVFLCLGLAEEARTNYARGLAFVKRIFCGVRTRVLGQPKPKAIKLATFKRRPNVPISVPSASRMQSMADFYRDPPSTASQSSVANVDQDKGVAPPTHPRTTTYAAPEVPLAPPSFADADQAQDVGPSVRPQITTDAAPEVPLAPVGPFYVPVTLGNDGRFVLPSYTGWYRDLPCSPPPEGRTIEMMPLDMAPSPIVSPRVRKIA